METITFRVQGSAQEPYTLNFFRENSTITTNCSCPAGLFHQHCKHRLNILHGITKGIVSNNESDVQIILSWLNGTAIQKVLEQYRQAEIDLEEAKKHLSKLKKKLDSFF